MFGADSPDFASVPRGLKVQKFWEEGGPSPTPFAPPSPPPPSNTSLPSPVCLTRVGGCSGGFGFSERALWGGGGGAQGRVMKHRAIGGGGQGRVMKHRAIGGGGLPSKESPECSSKRFGEPHHKPEGAGVSLCNALPPPTPQLSAGGRGEALPGPGGPERWCPLPHQRRVGPLQLFCVWADARPDRWLGLPPTACWCSQSVAHPSPPVPPPLPHASLRSCAVEWGHCIGAGRGGGVSHGRASTEGSASPFAELPFIGLHPHPPF